MLPQHDMVLLLFVEINIISAQFCRAELLRVTLLLP